MTTAAELYSLQEIDLAVDNVMATLADVEARLGEIEALIDARERAAQKREAVLALKAPQKELEWAVEEARRKASDIEKKLYGGGVRNPKELQDLQADLAALQTQVRRREDDLLNLMVQLDEAEAELREAEAALAAMEARWRSEQESLRKQRRELQGELAELEGKRAKQANGIDAGVANLYQLLRERRQGRAVAKVEQGMCQGCRIALPMSVTQKARAGLGLVQCVSCERILFVS